MKRLALQSDLVRTSQLALLILFCVCSPAKAEKYYGAASLQVKKKADVKSAKAANWNQALGFFNKNQYKDAAEKFEFVDAHGGCSEKTHYYLAQCYQMLNQTALAQRHYQWVSAYGKDSRLQTYARQAESQLAYYQQHRNYAGQGAVPHRLSMTSLPAYPAGVSMTQGPQPVSFG